MFTCTFGWVLAYSFATGRRTASTQTVSEPEAPACRLAPLVDAAASAHGDRDERQQDDERPTVELHVHSFLLVSSGLL